MIVTIHQPEHLPWLGFCHKASQADVLVLLDVVQFRTNYFQNRNRLLGANGPFWITVPVRQAGHMSRTIRDTEIDTGRPWASRWWKSLYYSYKATPHFADYAAFFEQVASAGHERLAELNEALIRHLLPALGISCAIVRASDLPVSGARSNLLADICGHLDAKVYLAGQHGKDYLDEAPFAARGIEIRHHEFQHPVYEQLPGAAFVSNLSVVDLLFRHGPRSAGVVRAATPRAA